MRAVLFLSFLFVFASGFSLLAQERIGRETGLPIPRYVSISSSEANMRRGPALDYPIDWVYNHKGYPVRVIAESNHWRKIEDHDGITGWFHYALLSGRRTVLVEIENITIFEEPDGNSIPVAIIGQGNTLSLKSCRVNWCEVEYDRYKGWIAKSGVWGVEADEVFED